MRLTHKQFTIMGVIINGDGKDAKGNLVPVDMDQLLERLNYKTTKESMQFSIRALIKGGMIYKGPTEIRRGRNRVTFFPTELGRKMTQLGSLPSFIEPEQDPEVSKLLSLGSTPSATEGRSS